MSASLPDALLARLSDFIAARMALHFPPSRWLDLERMARSASKELGFVDPESFIEGLLSSPLTVERMEILASHLTVGETYFWREPQAFDALEKRILPELVRSREGRDRRLRLWCAGCSTGEEAYSCAIALSRALPAMDGWKVSVLATDLSAGMLRKAKAGIYGEWSFRNAPAWLVEGYFRPSGGGKREILPEIRKLVSFEYLNLAENAYPAALNDTNAMDVILCRNVLMYFSPERAMRIVGSLYRALVDGGYLMVSACECSQLLFSEFATVQFPGATAYRKTPSAEAAPLVESTSEGKAPAQATPRPRVEASRPAAAPSIMELADRGRLSEALAACDAAIAHDRTDPRLHYLRATILQELNREGEAMASLKRSIYLDPGSVRAYFALGNLALRGGDGGTGKRCFRNALDILAGRGDDEVVPETEGLTAGRIREIIKATITEAV